MTTRVFTSSKAAIGHAVAVRRAAAGPASRRESAPGPAPDPWLASSVFACFRRAGLDPHDPKCPILREVLLWATSSDEADHAEQPKVGAAIRRVTAELEKAGIVARARGVEITGRRVVELDGRVQIVSTTHLDSGGVYRDPAQLRADLEQGRVAPVQQVRVWLDPDAARRTDIADVMVELRSGDEIDAELARRWRCSTRTARRHRTRLGAALAPGPKTEPSSRATVEHG